MGRRIDPARHVSIQNPSPDVAETCWTAEILNDSESTHDDTEDIDVSTVASSSPTRRTNSLRVCERVSTKLEAHPWQFVYACPSFVHPGHRPPSIAHAAYYFGVIKVRRTRDPCPNQIAKAHA
jgi:hypothetical protein